MSIQESMSVYRLVWHGTVIDVEYDVEALKEEDAMHTLCAWLQGDDVEGVRKVRTKKEKQG
jgi:hypothetical protein